jgi:hypothetical protein
MKNTATHFTKQTNKFPFCFIILVSILFAISLPVLSQETFYPLKPSDSIAKIPLRPSMAKKRFGRAAWQFGLAEMVPFVIDRYVRNVDYAQISFETVGHNIKPSSWEWDNDEFGTNQFAHPYHGSLFYSSFRTNGYSFWESVPAAFAGSYLWETFAEKQAPSINDFINTSFGGIVLGEMTYRLSNKIVNNKRRGFRRQAGEVFALLINPMNGLNRILDGKWGKVMRNSKERDSSIILSEFDIGQRKFNTGIDETPPRLGWYGHIKLLYGTPFENYRKPFSNIGINTEFGKDDSSLVNIISVYGSLAGWEIANNEKFLHYAILSANYDYIHNEAFFYSAQSVKMNIISSMGLMRHLKINSSIGMGPILLAAIPNGFNEKGRTYDYGSGIGVSGSGGLNLADRLYFGLNYQGAWIATLNGSDSHYFLHTLTTELRYMVIKNLSLCLEPGYFTLQGDYKNYPDVNHKYPYIRMSARYHYKFKN